MRKAYSEKWYIIVELIINFGVDVNKFINYKKNYSVRHSSNNRKGDDS
jgi:hypothetical protein